LKHGGRNTLREACLTTAYDLRAARFIHFGGKTGSVQIVTGVEERMEQESEQGIRGSAGKDARGAQPAKTPRKMNKGLGENSSG